MHIRHRLIPSAIVVTALIAASTAFARSEPPLDANEVNTWVTPQLVWTGGPPDALAARIGPDLDDPFVKGFVRADTIKPLRELSGPDVPSAHYCGRAAKSSEAGACIERVQDFLEHVARAYAFDGTGCEDLLADDVTPERITEEGLRLASAGELPRKTEACATAGQRLATARTRLGSVAGTWTFTKSTGTHAQDAVTERVTTRLAAPELTWEQVLAEYPGKRAAALASVRPSKAMEACLRPLTGFAGGARPSADAAMGAAWVADAADASFPWKPAITGAAPIGEARAALDYLRKRRDECRTAIDEVDRAVDGVRSDIASCVAEHDARFGVAEPLETQIERSVRSLGATSFWRLDETEGPMKDVIGGHDAIVIGDVERGAPGVFSFSKGVHLDGHSALVAPHAALPEDEGEVSIAVWMRSDKQDGQVAAAIADGCQSMSFLAGTLPPCSNFQQCRAFWPKALDDRHEFHKNLPARTYVQVAGWYWDESASSPAESWVPSDVKVSFDAPTAPGDVLVFSAKLDSGWTEHQQRHLVSGWNEGKPVVSGDVRDSVIRPTLWSGVNFFAASLFIGGSPSTAVNQDQCGTNRPPAERRVAQGFVGTIDAVAIFPRVLDAKDAELLAQARVRDAEPLTPAQRLNEWPEAARVTSPDRCLVAAEKVDTAVLQRAHEALGRPRLVEAASRAEAAAHKAERFYTQKLSGTDCWTLVKDACCADKGPCDDIERTCRQVWVQAPAFMVGNQVVQPPGHYENQCTDRAVHNGAYDTCTRLANSSGYNGLTCAAK
jgi:hypothetical protein